MKEVEKLLETDPNFCLDSMRSLTWCSKPDVGRGHLNTVSEEFKKTNPKHLKLKVLCDRIL